MTPTLLELEDELTHLTLAPELGGSIVNGSVRGTGQPLLRHSDAHALNTGLPGKLGCFPLVPWSNRIAEGGFECPERWLALTPNSLTDPLPITAAPGNNRGRWFRRRAMKSSCNSTAPRPSPIAPGNDSI